MLVTRKVSSTSDSNAAASGSVVESLLGFAQERRPGGVAGVEAAAQPLGAGRQVAVQAQAPLAASQRQRRVDAARPERFGASAGQLSALTTTNLDALRAYLDGVAAFRRGVFQTATPPAMSFGARAYLFIM